ncbi:hypothetical protein Plhal304r1_c027g0091171 [Plasmopara halstedii]
MQDYTTQWKIISITYTIVHGFSRRLFDLILGSRSVVELILLKGACLRELQISGIKHCEDDCKRFENDRKRQPHQVACTPLAKRKLIDMAFKLSIHLVTHKPPKTTRRAYTIMQPRHRNGWPIRRATAGFASCLAKEMSLT